MKKLARNWFWVSMPKKLYDNFSFDNIDGFAITIFNFLFYLSIVYPCLNLFPSKFIFSIAQINFKNFANFLFVNIREYYLHVANIYLHRQLSYW